MDVKNYICLVVILLSACSTNEVETRLEAQRYSFGSAVHYPDGFAFLTPSTVTGKEEDRQALALLVYSHLKEERPDVPVVPLQVSLGRINRADLSQDYLQMYHQYDVTGLFPVSTLNKLSKALDARYLVQLKLASFEQWQSGRFSVFGLRVVQTKYANMRLFVQVWDGWSGDIAWEAVEEVNYAVDTMTSDSVTFHDVVREAAARVIERMPPNNEEVIPLPSTDIAVNEP
ncbi:hypothetical protein [Gallaecimonas sp. GXIMD4217]|uniref:hypothetical protein n=1 Tax=Gallaecimonas sp. GXIMD4217 TaxID=3131927 RepID=UPI00311B0891